MLLGVYVVNPAAMGQPIERQFVVETLCGFLDPAEASKQYNYLACERKEVDKIMIDARLKAANLDRVPREPRTRRRTEWHSYPNVPI